MHLKGCPLNQFKLSCSESLELMTCQTFVGPPASGAPQAQPFKVAVSPQVQCLLGFHDEHM